MNPKKKNPIDNNKCKVTLNTCNTSNVTCNGYCKYLSYWFRVLIDVRDGGEAEEAAAPTPNLSLFCNGPLIFGQPGSEVINF